MTVIERSGDSGHAGPFNVVSIRTTAAGLPLHGPAFVLAETKIGPRTGSAR